jgi:hypothetical protein
MDTDQKHAQPRSSMARICSSGSDPEQSEAKPESGLQNLHSSAFICGFPLHGYG